MYSVIFVHLLIIHACTYILMCINWESMSEPHTTVFNREFYLCMCMYGPHILNFFSPHACTLQLFGVSNLSNYVLSMSDVASRLLSVAIGDLVPVSHAHWENYLLLLDIMNHLFAPVILREDVSYRIPCFRSPSRVCQALFRGQIHIKY